MLDLPISRRVVQLYRSCLTSRIHPFDFVNISGHSRLINSNLLERSKISLVKDNEVRSEEDSTLKRAHVQFVKNSRATSDFIKFYPFLELFEANSGLLQILYRL